MPYSSARAQQILAALSAWWMRCLAPGLRWSRRLLPDIVPLAAPADRTRLRRGTWVVMGIALVYTVVVTTYVFHLQNSEATHAEDLGIFDQVLWNTAHGKFWQQSICNSISDINCIGVHSRWAIHFEPLLLLLVPLYWFGAGPHALQLIQVAGVAFGALPAYWLACRRTQRSLVGVAFAGAYLAIPVLYSAVVDDFHLVTLAAPALMLVIYAWFDRRNRLFILACVIALGTKEQIALDVFMLGLACGVLQRRWRIGVTVMGLAVAWAVLALGVMHFSSPLGASPTAIRYGGLAATLARLPLLLLDPLRRAYLAKLMLSAGGVGLFAPWSLLLALPSTLLNALSNTPAQYSGQHQYNADIAPFLWLAMLEGSLVLITLLHQVRPYVQRLLGSHVLWVRPALSATLASSLLFGGLQFTPMFKQQLAINWPGPTTRTQTMKRMIALIPTDAVVSAQSELVPHLSHRPIIYQFPDGIDESEYIFLDFDSDYYPEPTRQRYLEDVQALLIAPDVKMLSDQDDYVLLLHTPHTSP